MDCAVQISHPSLLHSTINPDNHHSEIRDDRVRGMEPVRPVCEQGRIATPRGLFRTRPKGGCRKCRERRKKCDEQKPCCSACDKLGFSCGYDSTPRTKIHRKNTPVGPRQVFATPHEYNVVRGPSAEPSFGHHQDVETISQYTRVTELYPQVPDDKVLHPTVQWQLPPIGLLTSAFDRVCVVNPQGTEVVLHMEKHCPNREKILKGCSPWAQSLQHPLPTHSNAVPLDLRPTK
jgi:hypothetical protein